MSVTECTWRVRLGVSYPTYTLSDPSDTVEDVLCTLDLVAV
jgi:hypothetical protein